MVRATDLIAHLTEDAIDVDALEEVLAEIFADNPDVLSKGTQCERTNIRRLIRVYDYLKWGKSKEPSD